MSDKELKEKYSSTARSIMRTFVANKGMRIKKERFYQQDVERNGQVDDILDVLVEHGFIKYVCYSTVCHYVYVGKK